jgi:hypothetical protein
MKKSLGLFVLAGLVGLATGCTPSLSSGLAASDRTAGSDGPGTVDAGLTKVVNDDYAPALALLGVTDATATFYPSRGANDQPALSQEWLGASGVRLCSSYDSGSFIKTGLALRATHGKWEVRVSAEYPKSIVSRTGAEDLLRENMEGWMKDCAKSATSLVSWSNGKPVDIQAYFNARFGHALDRAGIDSVTPSDETLLVPGRRLWALTLEGKKENAVTDAAWVSEGGGTTVNWTARKTPKGWVVDWTPGTSGFRQASLSTSALLSSMEATFSDILAPGALWLPPASPALPVASSGNESGPAGFGITPKDIIALNLKIQNRQKALSLKLPEKL